MGDLGELVDVAPSTLSHHRKELDDDGVIQRARDGRYLYCRVNEPMLDQLGTLLRGSGSSGDERAA